MILPGKAFSNSKVHVCSYGWLRLMEGTGPTAAKPMSFKAPNADPGGCGTPFGAGLLNVQQGIRFSRPWEVVVCTVIHGGWLSNRWKPHGPVPEAPFLGVEKKMP